MLDVKSLGFELRDFKYYKSEYCPDGVKFIRRNIIHEVKDVYGKLLETHMGGNYGVGDEYVYIKHTPWNDNLNRFEIHNLLYYGDGSAWDQKVFKGTIKNISELSKLLSQTKQVIIQTKIK